MDQKTIFLTILGMMVVTYLPRVLPVWYLSSRSLPPLLTSWLRYVPVSVMAAMVLPSLVIQDQQISVGLDNVFLLAAFPTLLVAWRTKSLFGAVLSGMLVVALMRFLGIP
jgi:branched-subunit amino acid transport protein